MNWAIEYYFCYIFRNIIVYIPKMVIGWNIVTFCDLPIYVTCICIICFYTSTKNLPFAFNSWAGSYPTLLRFLDIRKQFQYFLILYKHLLKRKVHTYSEIKCLTFWKHESTLSYCSRKKQTPLNYKKHLFVWDQIQ